MYSVTKQHVLKGFPFVVFPGFTNLPQPYLQNDGSIFCRLDDGSSLSDNFLFMIFD